MKSKLKSYVVPQTFLDDWILWGPDHMAEIDPLNTPIPLKRVHTGCQIGCQKEIVQGGQNWILIRVEMGPFYPT